MSRKPQAFPLPFFLKPLVYKVYNKASNEKGVGLHIYKALLTPDVEHKGGFWLPRDL